MNIMLPCMQVNKNWLVKARVGSEAAAAAVCLRAWSNPSFLLSAACTYRYRQGGIACGLTLQVENFGARRCGVCGGVLVSSCVWAPCWLAAAAPDLIRLLSNICHMLLSNILHMLSRTHALPSRPMPAVSSLHLEIGLIRA